MLYYHYYGDYFYDDCYSHIGGGHVLLPGYTKSPWAKLRRAR